MLRHVKRSAHGLGHYLQTGPFGRCSVGPKFPVRLLFSNIMFGKLESARENKR